VFVFPHIGNLEVLMQIPLLYPQYRFVMLVERMRDDHLHRLMNSLRASQGLQLAASNEMLKVMRLLKQGWNLALAGDFDSTGSGLVVDFMGAPARMPDGAVRLALRTGSPLLIAYGWRELVRASRGAGRRRARARARFRLCITPPVALARSGDVGADVRRGVEEVVARLEPLITAHLDQWLAFHPIWQEAEA
jgi:KDO2-lipid IV(A) lauroyltransferase